MLILDGFAPQVGLPDKLVCLRVVDFEAVSLTVSWLLNYFWMINVLRWERYFKQQSCLCKFYRSPTLQQQTHCKGWLIDVDRVSLENCSAW